MVTTVITPFMYLFKYSDVHHEFRESKRSVSPLFKKDVMQGAGYAKPLQEPDLTSGCSGRSLGLIIHYMAYFNVSLVKC